MEKERAFSVFPGLLMPEVSKLKTVYLKLLSENILNGTT
jgi:hypothetical protein